MQLPFTDDELKPAIRRTLDKVAPLLAKDGGGITLIDIRQGVVYVQFTGGCVGCASSPTTLKYIVERQMHLDIHPNLRAVSVPVGMEDRLEEISID